MAQGSPRTLADLVVQMRSLRARERQNGVYDPLTLWKKLPGKNDRGEDTTSVAGRLPDSRLARPSSNRKINRFGQRSLPDTSEHLEPSDHRGRAVESPFMERQRPAELTRCFVVSRHCLQPRPTAPRALTSVARETRKWSHARINPFWDIRYWDSRLRRCRNRRSAGNMSISASSWRTRVVAPA